MMYDITPPTTIHTNLVIRVSNFTNPNQNWVSYYESLEVFLKFDTNIVLK